VKKAAKKHEKGSTKDINMAAVLGAGIMGGGIAYQTASKGTPIIMKDIASKALDLGMGEATKLLSKQVEKGRMTPAKMGKVLSNSPDAELWRFQGRRHRHRSRGGKPQGQDRRAVAKWKAW
jgi:hypothetical protein